MLINWEFFERYHLCAIPVICEFSHLKLEKLTETKSKCEIEAFVSKLLTPLTFVKIEMVIPPMSATSVSYPILVAFHFLGVQIIEIKSLSHFDGSLPVKFEDRIKIDGSKSRTFILSKLIYAAETAAVYPIEIENFKKWGNSECF
jgi:hypothetical protein